MKTPFISADEQAKPAEKQAPDLTVGGGNLRGGCTGSSQGLVSPQPPAAQGSVLSSVLGPDGGPKGSEGVAETTGFRGSDPTVSKTPSVPELLAEIAKLKHDLINAEAMRVGFNHLVAKMDPLAQFVRSVHTIAHRPFIDGTELALQTELKGLLDEVNR